MGNNNNANDDDDPGGISDCLDAELDKDPRSPVIRERQVCHQVLKESSRQVPREICSQVLKETYNQNRVQICKTDIHRYCEKISNIFPFIVVEQYCHSEPEKKCELEMKTCPKEAKKFSYAKDCKEQRSALTI